MSYDPGRPADGSYLRKFIPANPNQILMTCLTHGQWYAASPDEACPTCFAEKEPERKPIELVGAGEDLAKVRDFSAYISLKVVDSVATIKRIHQWPHVDYSVVMRDTRAFYLEDKCRVIHVDKGNTGEPIIEQYRMSMGLNANGIGFTLPSKAGMVEYGRDMMQRAAKKEPPYVLLPTKKSRNPLIRELWQQIAEQERIVGVTEQPRFAHPEGRHDDLFWTLMLALDACRPYLTEKTWIMRIR